MGLPSLGLPLTLLALAVTSVRSDVINSTNATTTDSILQTWWHNNGEVNYETPVQEGNVRQSHVYSASVGSDTASGVEYYNSFVYETIPRNGQGNIITPGDPDSETDAYDAITIEADIWITMAWTQFLYGADTWVKITRQNSQPNSSSNVVIRPSTLDFEMKDDTEGNVYILVPYRSEGYRFSVEFQDNLYSYRDSCDSTTCDFIQNWHPDGPNYVPELTDDMPVMGVEPHDALLVFASPMPPPDLVPDSSSPDTYVVQPGRVPDLSDIDSKNVYFAPGTYWMTATDHTVLSESVEWIHLAPGAYVKGAFEFSTDASTIKATGHGVLSGEQYVYQANTAEDYQNIQSNADSLRMWSGYSTPDQQQTFILAGLTTNAPPFNSIDFTGDLDTISIDQSDYKQVGAFFGQTDGTTLHSGSSVRDTFYHSGDDTIKTYGSDISVRDVVVWKGKTAPVVQFGWRSRDLRNITVDGVDVIHMKYSSNASHPSIIGANQVYGYPEDDTSTADLDNTVRDVFFGNIRAEGIGGNLMRIVPLAHYENVTIENVSLESFSDRTNSIYRSELPLWEDEDGSVVSITGFTVRNFRVGGKAILPVLGNIGPFSLGGLNIAENLLEGGGVIIE
ncbi:hypothetical protein Daus18300_014351 [Diaporthe australafricana]|uniref:Uncharacterized protein n=1 Tax=Diaporthe australafricana TaxID=127596 RepID=A0ABR3VVL5_9PEZI